ncbi:hypothetical protein OG568_52200 (plasmid) [Streptomyces sp. NBC_01450]|uniref:hypothetical protein n=1 Tax=Streptomyces sp. NBC_01450 TaxID=2903871 RepID=UPI002E333817|nr:hypothetical protein [Streptomyces sp. NBC_01450]
MVTGIEIAVGYLFAWGVRKARRVGDRADGEVDRALDVGMDRLHDLVGRKLGEDPALHRLAEEAGAGQEAPSERTRQRVQLALEDAAEQDRGFAEALNSAVGHLQKLGPSGAASAGDGGVAVSGDVSIRAESGSAAAWTMGDVNLGNPPQPGPRKG